MLRYLLTILLFLALQPARGQVATGIVADEYTRQPLPFAAIRIDNSSEGAIADIKGHFSFTLHKGAKQLSVSYTGYQTKTVTLPVGDTIFLSPATHTIGEVVVKPPYEKIRRIINTAIAHKKDNNPEQYDRYQCSIYYKLKLDYILPGKLSGKDTTLQDIKEFSDQSHAVLSETYSRRSYRRPQQLQENVIASRFSGLSKTPFTFLVTDFLPFHVYSDYIKFNTVDYSNPIAKGWQQRYDFGLEDEITDGTDTTFILKFKPKKNTAFNSLSGVVYINSNGYAISHIIAQSTDTTSKRIVKIEQIYRRLQDRWFPRELNYEWEWQKLGSESSVGLMWTGHSVVDSVSFEETTAALFDKAHPVKFTDSIDLHNAPDWAKYRFDTLSEKDKNTYTIVDSIGKEANLDKAIELVSKIGVFKIPLSVIDIDLPRIYAFNRYEGSRWGLGISTNEKLSKYASVGGWFGYGTRDKEWKYGGSLRITPWGDHENWLEFGYQNNYRSTGTLNLHPEIDKALFRYYLLAQVDRLEEYYANIRRHAGYWEIDARAARQTITPQYTSQFSEAGATGVYDVTEGSIGIRYAYAEKRTPFAGYYFSAGSKYPILYFRAAFGQLQTGSYNASYMRLQAALNYNVHINRWGKDNIRLTAGYIYTTDNKALPQSLLMAGNGYRFANSNRLQLYAFGGFITMNPFAYFHDRYAAIYYNHDFDWHLFKLKGSEPYLGIAHNILWGTLNSADTKANPGLATAANGYHESGLIINQLLHVNYLNLFYLNLNLAGFYHWAPTAFDWNANGRVALGLSLSF